MTHRQSVPSPVLQKLTSTTCHGGDNAVPRFPLQSLSTAWYSEKCLTGLRMSQDSDCLVGLRMSQDSECPKDSESPSDSLTSGLSTEITTTPATHNPKYARSDHTSDKPMHQPITNTSHSLRAPIKQALPASQPRGLAASLHPMGRILNEMLMVKAEGLKNQSWDIQSPKRISNPTDELLQTLKP